MRVAAILVAHNEARFIGGCLEHLVRQGVSVYLVDNGSTDGTVAIAEGFRGRGLLGIETLPYDDVYRWRAILERKERIAAELDADWVMHVDADERHVPPAWASSLPEALARVEDQGYNAVNFVEFTFVPTREAPDHDHADFERTMRWYYPYVPASPFLVRAWKRPAGPVELVWSGGHLVRFPGLRVYPEAFSMRHYLYLSVAHAVQKYAQRRYDPAEVQMGWHGWRARVTANRIALPSASELLTYTSDRELDASHPRTTHHLADLLGAARGADGAKGPEVSARTVTFILGAHRSGTSAATRLLNLLGVDLGRDLSGAAEDNPKGFWEHAGVVAINEAVLALLGTRWDDASPLPIGWRSMPALAPQRDAIRRLVDAEFAHAPLSGMKDPRLCRLLPLWLDALAPLPLAPVFVLVVRHPCEVAASLQKRNGLAPEAGAAMWLTHMLEAERHTRRHPRVFVSYDGLLADWRAEARRIERATGLSWTRSAREVEAEVDRFLDPALRHFTTSPTAWRRPGLSTWVAWAYRLMAAAAREETPTIRRRLALLEAEFRRAQAVFGPLLADKQAAARRGRGAGEGLAGSTQGLGPDDPAIRSLESQLAEQTAWARASAADVARRDRVIRELQASLEEQTRWAQATTSELAGRDAIIVELQRTVQEQVHAARTAAADVTRRDVLLTDLHALLREQAAWAEATAAEVARRDASIAELQALLDEQTRWAQASAAAVAERDANLARLQALLDEQTRWARTSAAAVAERDAIIVGLQASVRAQTRLAQESLAEVARRDERIAELEAVVNRAFRSRLARAWRVLRGVSMRLGRRGP